jgi:hypothetical protein
MNRSIERGVSLIDFETVSYGGVPPPPRGMAERLSLGVLIIGNLLVNLLDVGSY